MCSPHPLAMIVIEEPMAENEATTRWLGGLPAAGTENLKGRAREETAAYLEKCNEDEVVALRADLETELAEIEPKLVTAQSTAAASATALRHEIVLGALQAFEDRK
jgi:hypothetical protein